MEKLERSEAVIALGKRLVAALEPNPDRTAAWMAHLIAERMDAVERSIGSERRAAEDACASAIFQLWSHRFSAPAGINLLTDAVPIASALVSLDPNRKHFRVFSLALSLAEEENEKEPNDWLKLATELDSTSKELIRYALLQGAEGGMTSETFKETLGLAIEAGADVHLEIALYRNLRDETDLDESELALKLDNRNRWERAERLERFAALAAEAAAKLKSGMDEEPPEIDIQSILDI